MEFDPATLKINSAYSRKSLAALFSEPNLETSREGLYRAGNSVAFFVTLDKEAVDEGIKYNDYFDDGVFYWESQRQQSPQSSVIKSLISGEMRPYLFVRREARVRGITQEFIYAGRLEYLKHDPNSSNPVKFVFWTPDIVAGVGQPLSGLINWKPGQRHASEVPASLIEEGRRVRAERKSPPPQGGQGLEQDPEVRRAIELLAMRKARRYYEQDGYDVEDVSLSQPYDLVCRKEGGELRRVEVKGTRGDGNEIILTANEVQSAQDPGATTDLVICYGIVVEKSAGDVKASSGILKIAKNWKPKDVHLTPTQYRYKLSEKKN